MKPRGDDEQSARAWEHGPINNPVDRFSHLPSPTRKFLEELREDDIADLKDAIRMKRSAETIGRFGKWIIVTIIGAVIAGATFGEAIQKLWGWISHGGRP